MTVTQQPLARPSSLKDETGSIEKGQIGTDSVEVIHPYLATNGVYTEEEAEFLARFDDKARTKIYRKIDWRLIPMLAILYLFAYLDRANIGNAKIEGMNKDLKLTGTQYNIVLSIFFVPYILFEIPANAMLHRYFKNRPSWWIGGLATLWGICMTLHGVAQNYGGLVACRIALGICEAGFFPGAVLICSSWYPRNMLQIRIALFYTASALAGAFSGLLAFAIAKLDGAGGIAGWRYIFIIEGAATVALGLAVPFLLVDTAATSSWLTADEKRFVTLVTSAQDVSAAKTEEVSGVNWSVLKAVLTDWQLYVQGIIYWSNTVPNYAMKFTLPSIIKTMGYSNANAQLLTIPPYCVGAITALTAGLFSDKMNRRMPFIVAAQCCVITAFAILLPLGPKIKQNIGPAYFAICLSCMGYPISPGVNSWTANNLAGAAKRAMGVALLIGIGNIGGIIGSYIYIDNQAPAYPAGYGGSLAFGAAGLIAALGLEFALIRINKKRAAMSEEEIRAKYSDEELERMGDRSPLYRYTL